MNNKLSCRYYHNDVKHLPRLKLRCLLFCFKQPPVFLFSSCIRSVWNGKYFYLFDWKHYSFKCRLISPWVNTRYSTYMFVNGQGLNIWVHGHGPLTYYPQLTEFTSRLYFQPFRNIYVALSISNIIWWLSSDHRCVQLLLLLKELILFLWWIKEMSNRQKIHPAPRHATS